MEEAETKMQLFVQRPDYQTHLILFRVKNKQLALHLGEKRGKRLVGAGQGGVTVVGGGENSEGTKMCSMSKKDRKLAWL